MGVVILTEDGVKVALEDPALQEQIERAFRDAGPVGYAARHGERGELRWETFSNFGDRGWFEEVLRSLDPRATPSTSPRPTAPSFASPGG